MLTLRQILRLKSKQQQEETTTMNIIPTHDLPSRMLRRKAAKPNTPILPNQVAIEVEAKPAKKRGRPQGRPNVKAINMDRYIEEMDAMNIFMEHPFIAHIKLIENPYLRYSYARALHKENTIELSPKVLKASKESQRATFIRALCHFIAVKHFDELNEGEAHMLLYKRYLKRAKKMTKLQNNDEKISVVH